MLRSIRNVKLLKCVSLICLSPLFVFYSALLMYCPFDTRVAEKEREVATTIETRGNLCTEPGLPVQQPVTFSHEVFAKLQIGQT